MRGLRTVRRYKKYTYYFREVPNYFIDIVKRVFYRLLGNRVRGGRRSLVWKSKVNRAQTPRLVVRGQASDDEEGIPLTDPRDNMERRYSQSLAEGSIYSDNGSLQRPPLARANMSFGPLESNT